MPLAFHKSDTFEQINKGLGFALTKTGELDSQLSITYILLSASRDPESHEELIELNAGNSAVYLVLEGMITFTSYEEVSPVSTVLNSHEYVQITPGSKYDIAGTGTIALIVTPAYSKDTFTHPRIR